MAYKVYRLGADFQPSVELRRVRSLSIKRDITDDAPLIESATIECDGDAFQDGWYRIYNLGAGRTALGSFYFTAQSSKTAHGVTTWTADGYSALYPASQETVAAGACARAGADAGATVSALLASCPGGVEVKHTHALAKSIVFDSDATKLEAVWQVLDACSMCIQLDGGGKAVVMDVPRTPAIIASKAAPYGIKLDSISCGKSYERDGSIVELRPFDLVSVCGNSGHVLTQSVSCGVYLSINEEIGELDG